MELPIQDMKLPVQDTELPIQDMELPIQDMELPIQDMELPVQDIGTLQSPRFPADAKDSSRMPAPTAPASHSEPLPRRSSS
jgi:hypothetical protein